MDVDRYLILDEPPREAVAYRRGLDGRLARQLLDDRRRGHPPARLGGRLGRWSRNVVAILPTRWRRRDVRLGAAHI